MPGEHACYELRESEVADLTRRLLAGRDIPETGRFVCLEVEGSDPLSNVARHLELEVFAEQFGNDADCLSREYGPYENSSLFFVVIDTRDGAPAGAVRMIRNSAAGLKTLVDMADPAVTPTPVAIEAVMRIHRIDDLDRCWDGGSGVVDRRYRMQPAVLLGIFRSWYAAVVRDDVAHYVSIQASAIRRSVERFLKVPLVPLADTPPFLYMEEPGSQAVYGHIATALCVTTDRNRLLGRLLRGSAVG